jgi:hypothetical protein
MFYSKMTFFVNLEKVNQKNDYHRLTKGKIRKIVIQNLPILRN